MRFLGVILLLVMAGRSSGDVPLPEKTYNILMLLTTSSKSHRNIFMPVAEALADRSHKIVMLTNHNKPSKHPNIYEVFHGLPYFNTDNMNMFEERAKGDSGISFFRERLPAMARDLYTIPKVMELYKKRKQFDLIVVDHMFNEPIYPFLHEMPFITISAVGMDHRQSAVLGNPLNPAYVPGMAGSFDLSSVFGRLLTTMGHILVHVYWRHWGIVPFIQKEIDAQFPDLPSLLDLERNQSLTLINSHFTTDLTLPLLPSQVEIGAMHCRAAQPLPEDLQSWLDGAGSSGVIYFSLGSIARGETMPVQYRNMLLEAFKRMDQRILWKFEKEVEGLPDNILIRDWLPQQDILAHPNVKVFITHGGLLSTQEASYHGTPLLALPIFGDQPKNGENIISRGLGLSLVWEELTVDMIVNSLQEIINNPKYRERAAEVSKLLKDQMETPLERAVFWTEYVIRHRGAPKLRSPAANLSWVEFLLLDAAALLIFIIVICLLLIRWIVKRILRLIFGTRDTKRKQE